MREERGECLMAMLRVGDTLKRTPSVNVDEYGRTATTKVPCTVVYIHPQRRFYVVRFTFGSRSFCESYLGGWAQYEQV